MGIVENNHADDEYQPRDGQKSKAEDVKCKNCGYIFIRYLHKSYGLWVLVNGQDCPKCKSNRLEVKK